jgi:hypothetical protein
LNFYGQQPKQGDDVLQPQAELEKDNNNKSVVVEFQDYNAIESLGCFTQLTVAPTCDANNLEF